MREKIKEIILEVRQHLCNTEFAPPPFDDEPLDCNWFNGFTDQILTLIREEIEKCLLADEEISNTLTENFKRTMGKDPKQYFNYVAENDRVIAQAQLQKILKALEV